jgi:Mrp family chromosome partitioning ATPase
LAGIENEVATARAQEERLLAELNTLKARSAQAGSDQVELRALEREATAQRALLESYLTRYREAASRADRNYLPADVRIFARAATPYQAYFPKVVPIAGSAFAGALLLLVVITLLRELFSGRAMRPAGQVVAPVEQVRMPDVVSRDADPAPENEAEPEPPVEDEPAPHPVGEAPAEPQPDEREVTEEETACQPDDLSIVAAADRLVAGGTVRAVFVSPEGDEAGATSVMVAREVADAGLRVLFLDLTYSGAPSSSMLDSGRYPGITNLLASEAQFADIIHGDLYSDCHVIPLGTADPERASRAIDRLPIVMDSLTTAYDIVVVECGATDAAGIRRVVGEGTVVLISAIRPGDGTVTQAAADLRENGYDEVPMVSPGGYSQPPAPEGRSAA